MTNGSFPEALTCGRTFADTLSEDVVNKRREGDPREAGVFKGCAGRMNWGSAYRCLQCGRWIHGKCLGEHFTTP